MKDAMEVARLGALEAGALIRRSVGRCARVSFKGRDNIVTDVDRASEALIIKRISGAFPEDSILSEESGLAEKSERCRWLIDPLDGTTNFSRSFPFFAVSIAREKAGVLETGVIYDPMRDELFQAERSKGAYLNKKRIRVSGVSTLGKAFLATGFSYGLKRKDKNIANFRKFLVRSLAIRRAGSAALDLAYVAAGRFDGFWEMDLHPWDSAAGSLIVTEAGGRVTKFDGSPHVPEDKEILATNRLIHHPMLSLLKIVKI